ncbi:amino acid ABC transporter permease [Mesorhizobium sp. CO1-1-8]|uniref:amino acid ABC transporter permease n=1 Tax=Mesorhizobium sp. CO1-1-8 TaxID=2876631 RepID=UPI001CD0DE58|nr:amino acid ABC transporter permease [Mesorhizobium sp. CO1-1-8]MBZ9775027.1 amino acid ABC transporter permease [Mesorhizobium sp. CO1-1-8]
MDALLMGVTWEDVVSWLPSFWNGFLVSVRITLVSLAIGIPLGFLFALGVQARNRAIRYACLALVEIGRGAPALVLLQFVYYGLPNTGLSIGAFMAASIALSFNTGAYTSEIIRAGLDSVPAGQKEAVDALGMTSADGMRFVIAPQGIRVAIPALLGFAILVFQGTSLCFAIAVPELISRAYDIGSMQFYYFPALTVAGIFYVAVCIPASFIVSWAERRAGAYSQR